MHNDSFARIRAAFDRAAPQYEEAAVLQHEVTSRLVERLQYLKLKPQTVLDLGAGTGSGTRALHKQYPSAQIVALDCAPGMLRELKARAGFWRKPLTVCADAQQLPFRDGTFELIFSSLTLQWCLEPGQVLQELFRVLKPGGAVLFATLGPDTLYELRDSWAAVDGAAHTNHFMDMHHLGDGLVAAGFGDPVMDSERIVLTYREVGGLLRDIKQIGANTLLDADNQIKNLTGKMHMRAMHKAYEAYRNADGLYPATYEVVYGLAWGRDPNVRPVSFVPADQLRSRG
jgi:malonyl-CoA O-methyltransferase